MRILRTAAMAAATVCVPVIGTAEAQAQQQQEMIPLEMVQMLQVMSGPASRLDVMVGRLPPDLAELLQPGADTRIVGTMDYGMLSTSAAVTARGGETLRSEWMERLRGAGWTDAPAPIIRPQAGFVSDYEPAVRQEMLCHASGRSIVMSSGPHRGDSAAVVIMLAGRGFGGSCGERGSMTARPDYGVELPKLHAPEGSHQRGSSSGGGPEPIRGRGSARL